MSDFTLVDLDSQAIAFVRHTKGWEVEDILGLMKKNGDVTLLPNRYNDLIYVFCSTSGIKTSFRFTENGRLVILRDNTTYLPDIDENEKI